MLSTYDLFAACIDADGAECRVIKPDIVPPAVGSFVGSVAVTMISEEPSKETPLIVCGVCNRVAVDALPVTDPVRFPVNAAVIVPAAKLPELSLETIVLIILLEVASTVIVLGTIPLYVANAAALSVLLKEICASGVNGPIIKSSHDNVLPEPAFKICPVDPMPKNAVVFAAVASDAAVAHAVVAATVAAAAAAVSAAVAAPAAVDIFGGQKN